MAQKVGNTLLGGTDMKTRVKFSGNYYYAQVKGLLFWRYIWRGDNYAYFTSKEDAVAFIEKGDWMFDGKVVWKS